MLTQAQKRQLKGLANKIDVRYQVGKSEVTDTVISMLDKALTARELIKIDVMKGATEPIMEIALDLSSALHAEIVQVVGRVIVMFRQNKEKSKIKLVKD